MINITYRVRRYGRNLKKCLDLEISQIQEREAKEQRRPKEKEIKVHRRQKQNETEKPQRIQYQSDTSQKYRSDIQRLSYPDTPDQFVRQLEVDSFIDDVCNIELQQTVQKYEAAKLVNHQRLNIHPVIALREQ